MNSIFCTICTATFNRKKELNKLYDSLNKQTLNNFEWIIIDDGSTDDTELQILEWKKKELKYNIKYIKTENRGKHKAINKGIEIAEGKMLVIVDSDDYLTNNAIETIYNYEKSIQNNKDKKWGGIAFNKCYENKQIIGQTFNGEYVDCTSIERNKYNIIGDKLEVFYTYVLKENKFPEFENEKFLTENILWYNIAKKGYYLRWINEAICICKYQEDGLTKNIYKHFKTSPQGTLLFVKNNIECLGNNLRNRIKYYSFYSKVVYDYKNIEKTALELGTTQIKLKFYNLIRKISERLKGRN